MKTLVCELCGGHDLLKQSGMYVCQDCGAKYTVEEAKGLMTEASSEIVEKTKEELQPETSKKVPEFESKIIINDDTNQESGKFDTPVVSGSVAAVQSNANEKTAHVKRVKKLTWISLLLLTVQFVLFLLPVLSSLRSLTHIEDVREIMGFRALAFVYWFLLSLTVILNSNRYTKLYEGECTKRQARLAEGFKKSGWFLPGLLSMISGGLVLYFVQKEMDNLNSFVLTNHPLTIPTWVYSAVIVIVSIVLCINCYGMTHETFKLDMKKDIWLLVGVAAVVFLIFTAVMNVVTHGGLGVGKADKYGNHANDAKAAAMVCIDDHLKSPSSAKYSETSAKLEDKDKAIWIVTGKVESKNSFGAKIKEPFTGETSVYAEKRIPDHSLGYRLALPRE